MIKIRGQEVDSKDKVTIHRKFSEEHDTGKIRVVNNIDRRYEMYSTVDYTNGTITEQLLVESDSVVQTSPNEYTHEISLIENKAKFDGIYPADRSFTKIGQTIENILNVYKRELGEYHSINIDWSLTTEQLNNIMPFKEFSGVNFTTILVSLFRKINAVLYVDRQDTTWVIKARPYNERGALISGESITKSFTQSNIDYATKVKSQLKNAINERAQVDVEYYPSKNGYVLPKSPKPIKATSDLEYKMPSPIVRMLEVIAIVDYIYQMPDGSGGTTDFEVLDAQVDITSQVVTSDEYDVLRNETGVTDGVIWATNNKKNNIKYNIFGRTVYDLFESNTDRRFYVGFDTEYLLNALRRVITQLLPDGYTGFSLGNQTDGEPTTEEIKLRFKYAKQRDIDIVTHRKTKGDMNNTTTIHNQRDSNVEISQYKKALKNYANRMGNNEFSKSKNFKNGETPHSITDFLDDGKVVVETINTYHGNFVFCDWIEVDNFSNLEAEYAISRSPSPFTINNKTVQTNIVAEEYVWFSDKKVGIDTRLTDFAQRGLLGLFESGVVPNFEKIHSAVFKPVLTSWDSSKAISMEIASDGDANLITFHSYFDHQLRAANIYYNIETDTVDDLQPLKYTDDNGELADFQIYYVPDILVTDSGEHPLIIDEVDYINNKHTENNVNEPLDLDINASFAFTYNISFVADKDIFVGEFLSRNNYLISDQQDTFNLEIYKSSKPYTLYDQEPRATDVLANMTFVYDFTNRKITFTALETVEHFTLTQNGNILLAINKTLQSGESYVVHINIIKRLADNLYIVNLEGSMTITGTVGVRAQQFFTADVVGNITIDGVTAVVKDENFSSGVIGTMIMTGSTEVIKFEDINYSADVSGSMAMTATTGVVRQEFVSVDVVGSMNISGSTIGETNIFEKKSSTTIGSMSMSGTNTIVKNEAYLVWDYIGTSGTQDYLTDLGTSGTSSCRTSAEAEIDLEQTNPAANYQPDDIMKVEHDYEDPTFGTSPCTPFYYRAVLVLD